jgi:hypothetical protein
MYNQVLQAPIHSIRVCVDVYPVQGEPNEARGIMRDQRRQMYIVMCVGSHNINARTPRG